MQDEESLVQRAKQRDQKAFTQLYEGYFDKIYRYTVIKIGNETEAEDMTQQVFVRAYESIGSYRSRGVPFSAWLFRIAHNQIVDYVRKRSKKQTISLDETLPIMDNTNLEHDVETKFEMEKVATAAKQLTKAQQEVISLRFAGGLSIAEVAKTMRKSEGAIKALQHSAILALRKTLLAGEKSGN